MSVFYPVQLLADWLTYDVLIFAGIVGAGIIITGFIFNLILK